MAEIEIAPLEKIPEESWRRLLEKSKYATVYHTLEWMRVWIETFPSWKGFFILLREGDELRAGMPIIETNRFGLKTYYSMPYGTYGGAIGEMGDKEKEEFTSYLLKYLKGSFKRVYIEDFGRIFKGILRDFSNIEITTHIAKLFPDPDKLWKERIHKKIKEQVRESHRKGVEVQLLKGEEEIHICYEMLTQTTERHREEKVRFPLELYRNIFKIMSERGALRWTVALRGKAYLSHLISFLYRGTIYFWGNASFNEALLYRPNNALFWEMMEWGCKNGFEYANIGSSPPKTLGLIRWKERLGGEEVAYNEYRWESWIWKLLRR